MARNSNEVARRSGRLSFLVLGALVLLLSGCSASKASGAKPQSQAAAQQQPTVVQAVAASGAGSIQATGAPANRPRQQPGSNLPAVAFTGASGSQATLSVEIADTEATQECGLMNRTSMPDNQGMLFMFSRENTTPFWMKDTLIPLSIAFIDANGTVVDVQEMQAESEDLHTPAKAYQYAIEANAGWFSRNGIAPGDRADLSQAIAASPVFGGAPPLPSPCHETSGG
jgi:uncharacterized membrane protein (UPF0127 family)